jgi:hypothetical protein
LFFYFARKKGVVRSEALTQFFTRRLVNNKQLIDRGAKNILWTLVKAKFKFLMEKHFLLWLYRKEWMEEKGKERKGNRKKRRKFLNRIIIITFLGVSEA